MTESKLNLDLGRQTMPLGERSRGVPPPFHRERHEPTR
jgi:hypothetical protein